MNKVFLIGRLTKDPELRYTTAGVAVARFTLAVNRPARNDGQDEADFLRIVAWRKLAEICGDYLKKGKLVAVEGRLQYSSFEKNGEKIQTVEVIAENMQMLDRKTDGGSQGAYVKNNTAPAPQEEAVPF